MQEARFTLHILFHPIDGFYDMKFEKKGKLYVALIGVFLFAFTNIFKQDVTGFLFNPIKFQDPNVIYQIIEVLVIFILFCVGNWSITTLLDGEGKFKDIVMVFGYSCFPIAMLQIPLAILTNICTYSESSFIQVIQVLAMCWFFFDLFLGIMTIHQYNPLKMFATALLTIVAMMVLAIIYLLFFNMVSQMVIFVLSVYKEISFRLL